MIHREFAVEAEIHYAFRREGLFRDRCSFFLSLFLSFFLFFVSFFLSSFFFLSFFLLSDLFSLFRVLVNSELQNPKYLE